MEQGISATGWCLEGNKESTFFCGWRFNHRTCVVKRIFVCFVGLKFPSILGGQINSERISRMSALCSFERMSILRQKSVKDPKPKTWTKHTVSTSIARVGGGHYHSFQSLFQLSCVAILCQKLMELLLLRSICWRPCPWESEKRYLYLSVLMTNSTDPFGMAPCYSNHLTAIWSLRLLWQSAQKYYKSSMLIQNCW